MFAPKSILVPTDFSRFSDNAPEKAYDIAKQFEAKAHFPGNGAEKVVYKATYPAVPVGNTWTLKGVKVLPPLLV